MSKENQQQAKGGGLMGGVDPALVCIAFVVAICTSIYQYLSKKWAADKTKKKRPTTKKVVSKEANKKLSGHTGEFNKKEIVTVRGQVHSAIGYGLANCILIEGEESCIVIDTLESIEAAEDVIGAFKTKIPDKPIVAVILTHFHADHANGIDAFLKIYPNLRVYAHESLQGYFKQLLNVRAPITYIRAVYQFGTHLSDAGHENSGIGISLRFDGKQATSLAVNPTHLVKDKMTIKEAGIELELYHAPGETADQMIVWWPEKEILFPADNIYRAFPNLYAIRGTMARDTLLWVKAVDFMRKLKPETLVPQHTRPLEGKEVIMETLTAYRDAIQIVHDQTVRYMNKGLYPDEITQYVRLPENLAKHPYLQEFYGTVEWSVKAVFCNYMGWYSGNPSELHPLPPSEQAEMLVDLAGGPEKVFDKLKEAYEKGKIQWALQLTHCLLSVGKYTREAKLIQAECLRILADGEVSACGRNWYLTAALVTEGLEIKPSIEQKTKRIKTGPLREIFLTLTVMVDFDKTAEITESASFNFTDTNEKIIIKIRNGLAELLADEEKDFEADIKVTTESVLWRQIMCKEKSPAAAVLKGGLKVEPSATRLATFMSYFDTE